ncbi:MAG: hypothetical protein IPP89_08560 [Saprospiraceae bacterium]|nr:hypothetical protein [Candidatus Brachybacter algidus]MBL0119022.1 hypothetical protein [Candidatus Brachybacter algidus]
MKYLTFLLFLLGGFLNHAEGQTIQDYSTYVSSLLNSGDPNQILEGQRIQNYTTGLYPSTYFSSAGVNVVGAKRSKKLICEIESLNLTGYDDATVQDVEMIVVLVRKVQQIGLGQISQELRSKMPNLKNIVIIAEFPSVPSQFTTILPPASSGYVALHKVSITE